MPDWVHQLNQSDLPGGDIGGITADNDPRNIPPKIYLPILLLAIVVALIVTDLVLAD